jgi:serine/threonine protein kinase
MAPEILSRGEVSWRGDIWALGISAIELADQKNPYADLGAFSAISFIQNNPPPKLSDNWSPEFQEFISLMLKKNPEERSSAFELLTHPFLSDASHKAMLDVYAKYAENTGMNKQEKLQVIKSFQEAEAKIALIPIPGPTVLNRTPSASLSSNVKDDTSSFKESNNVPSAENLDSLSKNNPLKASMNDPLIAGQLNSDQPGYYQKSVFDCGINGCVLL